jgi:hypothetical protein
VLETFTKVKISINKKCKIFILSFREHDPYLNIKNLLGSLLYTQHKKRNQSETVVRISATVR